MSPEPSRLRVFLDEGVPDTVGRVFAEHGHDVIYLREAIKEGSSDTLVCAAAEANDAILVALDGDMRQIARGHGVGGGRFKRLSLIKLSCPEPQAANRVEQAMSLLEHEWQYSEGKVARRMFVEISAHVIRTVR